MNVFKKIWHKIESLFKQPETTNSVEKTIRGIIKKNIDRLNNDIHELDKQKEKLAEKLGEITEIELSDISGINKSLEKLNRLFDEKSAWKVKFTVHKPKSTQPFEDLLSINNLLKQFQDREKARQRKEELHKKEIKSKLEKIELLISQDKLDEAKTLIAQIQKQIKLSYTHEIKRLGEYIQKLNKRELQIFKKRQEEEQKKHDEEAKRLREIEDKRQEKLRKRKEAEERAKRDKEEKKRQANAALEALLVRKTNWKQFQEVLHKNGITTLYHFTDIANIDSIKNHGGLYSWSYCDNNGITIPYPGGDTLSRGLDKQYNLQDFVRLSFCNDHPMKWRLEQDGRDLVLLEIKIDVAYFEKTQFSDINATDSVHKHGATLQDLQRINFKATQRNYVSRDDADFKLHQAEMLIKTWIPKRYITNI
jgi:hypothetical protein